MLVIMSVIVIVIVMMSNVVHDATYNDDMGATRYDNGHDQQPVPMEDVRCSGW